MSDYDTIFDEGYNFFRSGLSLKANPYPYSDEDESSYQAWQDGWICSVEDQWTCAFPYYV